MDEQKNIIDEVLMMKGVLVLIHERNSESL